MRSELIFGAMKHVSNRYLLASVAAKATRKLHRPHTRVQETMNDVLSRSADANPLATVQAPGNLQRLRRTKWAPSRNADRTHAAA